MREIKEILEYLTYREWKITIEQMDTNDFKSYAQRGDFNCPHRKEYDPKDGHGVSQVWAEGFDYNPNNRSKSIEESLNKLYELCLKVIPGELYPTTPGGTK